MKAFRFFFLLAALFAGVACGSKSELDPVPDPDPTPEPTPEPAVTVDARLGTTYQLLVYSFADSNNDGIGDFKGIQNHLDYFEELGVSALWLSPIHPADSYHGYDVRDYSSVNPDYGTESDFKNLLAAAHAKGIQIYLDYVLNHTGKGHPWFKEALSDASSSYRDFYFISSNPSADYSKFPMLSGTAYESGEWKQVAGGAPSMTITKTGEAVTNGTSEWNLWVWPDAKAGSAKPLVDNGDGTGYIVLEMNGKTGLLLRKGNDWSYKFGASSAQPAEGTSYTLAAGGGDIFFTGDGRYRIDFTNLSAETLYFMGAFGDWMPDLNYGAVGSVESNPTFQALAASADKWLGLGVDGFRLDAVKHICGGISSYNNASNQSFLKKWFEHCNASYKKNGHSGNIFMVGEVWSGHDEEKLYYKGIPSCFEFGYWPTLYAVLTSGNAGNYVSTVAGFVTDHKGMRTDAVTSLFLTNHDHASQTGYGEVRAADDLGRNLAKEKQAAAMLLTSPGKPFIYQGEELGYWGNSRGRGDEYLRAPIVWNASATDCAKGWASGKVDNDMLKGSISVETQRADANSLLNVYKAFGQARKSHPALAAGNMSDASLGGTSIASWYMTYGTEKLLVVHNVSASQKTLTLKETPGKIIVELGTVSVSGKSISLGANSSVVLEP